jgi:hypothetical protein
LNHKVFVILTDNDADYAKAIEHYSNSNYEQVQQAAETTAGISLYNKPIVILRGTKVLENYPIEAKKVLPHEIFHQVQYSYGVNSKNTPEWFLEGSAEFFRYLFN